MYAENNHLTDTLVHGMVSKVADNIVTSGNDVLRFEEIEYFSRSEILLCKNYYR
jgi:hypothetical protein